MRNANETYQKPEILEVGAVTDLTGECSEGCGFDNLHQTAFVKDDGASPTLQAGLKDESC